MGNKATKKSDNSATLKWIKMKKKPESRSSNVVLINKNTLLIATQTDKKKNNQYWIYKYSINQNKWTKLVRIPYKVDASQSSLAYENSSNTLYLCNASNKQIFQLCLSNEDYKWQRYGTSNAGFGGSRSILIGNKLHIIGGSYNYKHLTFDTISKKTEGLSQLPIVSKYGLMYDKSKQTISLYGGNRRQYKSDGKSFKSYQSMSIMEYSFETNVWTNLTNTEKISMPHRMASFGYVFTEYGNRKYMLFFGGSVGFINASDNIYIFDVEKKIFKESCVKCPDKSSYDAILVEDGERLRFVICGFVRGLSNSVIVPDDIINVINCMCDMKYIHLFCWSGHWKIGLDDIMNDVIAVKMPQLETKESTETS